ncbi:MAG: glycine cleavage T C-terminal barrel domain-containing protein [Streptomycetales bacterium]
MVDFPVRHDGTPVGHVTSACYSPRLERNIGFAMLPVHLTGLGTGVEVDTPHERTSAVVTAKPFIDPAKNAPKQDVSALIPS